MVSFSILLLRVAHLQLVEGETLARASMEQRLRIMNTPAPRGRIYASDGTVLAENRPAFVVQYIPTADPPSDATLFVLSGIIEVPISSIRNAIEEQDQDRPYAPVDVAVDLDSEQYTKIQEQKHLLPGFRVVPRPVRRYPEGSLAAHVIGHALTISERELQTFEEASGRSYQSDDIVGKAGVEKGGEFELQGYDGEVRVEVDAYGRLVDSVLGREPQPGENAHLTIRPDLQALTEDAIVEVLERLQEGRNPVPFDRRTGTYGNLWDEGEFRPADTDNPNRKYEDATQASAVVLDVQSGKVLAMASYPTYDPNVFATAPLHLPGSEGARAWSETWENLNDPASDQPLSNRAISQIAAPGSTFKMVTGLAALEVGLNPRHTHTCRGRLDAYGQQYGCWTTHGSGINLVRGLAVSCNVYFYQLAQQIGVDRIASMAEKLGLGDDTGVVGLPSGEESSGIRPSSEWKQEVLDETWYPGETLMAGIGQGYHAYTPLQMANYAAIIANGGTHYRPYVLDYMTDASGEVTHQVAPEIINEQVADPEHIRWIQRGMEAANERGGTGYSRFADYPKPHPETGEPVFIATKTGTSEVRLGVDNHGWFVAYAPAEEPEIAVAVVVYHGGGGSLAGAPVARMIFEHYFGYLDLNDREVGGLME